MVEKRDDAKTTQVLVETTSSASGFVETGYIYGVHGLQGEVRVKPSTDFPELRFSKPGTRWLKQQVSGTETLQEIELVEGRGHPGQSWIVRFNNINTVEQAQKLVGSTILVTDKDRPDLEEGEFYTHDLIGMRVILKESGEPIGIVANVFNSGASDLLHVKLNSLRNIPDKIGKSKTGTGDSGPLVWVPFVESIVPTVDLEKGEMLITPPKGLLELNIRSDERSKKERRMERKKKVPKTLDSSKKKLCEMEQEHVFHGFRYGDKDQRGLLAYQIVTLNSKLLQQALQTIETPLTRPDLLNILTAVPRLNTVRVSGNPCSAGVGKLSDPNCKLQREGNLLISNGKVAIFLVLDEIGEMKRSSDANLLSSEGKDNACLIGKAILDYIGFVESVVLKNCSQIMTTTSFDPEKVWFLEEEKLPVVSSSLEGHGKHKILMKSPWEFLQRPIGSGGLISLLSSQESLLDQLSELGVEYIQVLKSNKNCRNSHQLVGLVDSCKANVGVNLFKDITSEEDFDVVLSMSFLRKLVKQINKLEFEAVLTCNSYVENVDKEWVDVVPSSPNSYEFHSSIYNCLNATPSNKVTMAVPLLDKKIIKKRVKKFKRPQSDRFISVKPSWRRPKGIDSRVRRKFKGSTLMPNIGYGSDKKTRHYLPNGFKKFLVHNVKELELLMMHNRKGNEDLKVPQQSDRFRMAGEQLKPVAGLLLILNFCMYTIILGIGGWAMNRAINHGFVIGPGFELPAHFSPIYFPMGNAATGFFVVYALIAGVVGVASAISGLNHIRYWDVDSLPAAASAATIAWTLTLLAMGFAWKEIELHFRNARLRTMEAFIIILSATQLLYLAAIHGAASRRREKQIL
ncbi:UNVERIFIED_CONTAM: Ribosome maturation factor RimM [Sesamum calycinum]|uniref:Ribosome maturation factor RimM n=1 Tax=Sesamum calycinum TaxID=2727403 RepID=A0AAW2Q6N5_9LAMI